MPNSSAIPTGEQKSFRTNHGRDRVNTRKLLDGLVFYPLTLEEVAEISSSLKATELKLLLRFRAASPFGDHPIDITVRGLARTMQLDPAAVSRALRQLKELGHIDLEVLPSRIRVYSRGKLYERLYPKFEEIDFLEPPELELCKEELLHTSTVIDSIDNIDNIDNIDRLDRLDRLDSAVIDSIDSTVIDSIDRLDRLDRLDSTVIDSIDSIDSTVIDRIDRIDRLDRIIVEPELEVVVNNNVQPREFQPGEGFGAPKPNQDTVNKAERETGKAIATDAEMIDQPTTVKEAKSSGSGWQNFVAPGGDPEFFAFVVRRTAKLPQPPADAQCAAEGWIRKQGHVLYPQYVAWKSRQTVTAEPVSTSAPPPTTEPLEMTLAERLAKYQSMWQIWVCRKGIKAAIAAHPEWGLQIGRAGPEMSSETATISC